MAADIHAALPDVEITLDPDDERIGIFLVVAGGEVLWNMDETGTFPASSRIIEALRSLPSPRRG